jgi:hypothetical protein
VGHRAALAEPPASCARSSPALGLDPEWERARQGYVAGRNATWIWKATPGAVKPNTSLVL